MRRILVLLAVAALASVGLMTTTGFAASRPAAAVGAVPRYGHVVVLIGENKSLSQVTSSGDAPYIMGTIKPHSAWFTGYHSVTTGSLADYIALTSGQYADCQRHGPCGKFDVPNIFAEAQAAGVSWTDWNESMPGPCWPSSTGSTAHWNHYKIGHNPALWYTDLRTGSPSLCERYDLPAGTTGPVDMSTFNTTLANGTALPEYSFVTPNGCESGHDSCYGYDSFSPASKVNPIREYDHFLEKEVPRIQSSPACAGDTQAHTCLIVATADEGSHSTLTLLAVMGSGVVDGTYDGYYDHYSTLRTVEDALGLACTAKACGGDYTGPDGVTHQAVDLPIF